MVCLQAQSLIVSRSPAVFCIVCIPNLLIVDGAGCEKDPTLSDLFESRLLWLCNDVSAPLSSALSPEESKPKWSIICLLIPAGLSPPPQFASEISMWLVRLACG